MRRRALLGSLAVTLTAAAGCVSDGATPGDSRSSTDSNTATDDPTTTQTQTGTQPSTDTTTPDDPSTATPTPPTSSDAFADFDCPSFEDTARTVCYHTVDLDEAPLVLTAEPEVFGRETDEDNAETIEFVLYNRSGASVGFNPYDWGVERHEDGEWTHVAPEMIPEPWTGLSSGETFRWAIPAGSQPTADDEQRQPVDVALDPGVYAFHLSVLAPQSDGVTDSDGATSSERVELIALFDVETAIGSP